MEGLGKLWYLIAAYSAVWIILACFLVVLLQRNQVLSKTLSKMEGRIRQLEEALDRKKT